MVTDNAQPVNPGPAEYADAGFRILPIASDGSKRPLVEKNSFGKEYPDFTVEPENFRQGDMVAILCGPTPRWADSDQWLAVIDIDGDASIQSLNEYVGEDLPPTLSSKGYRHLYYRVPASEARAALRQWAPLFGRKTEGAPKVDLKWSGGYAIEPEGAWDRPWDPDAIAVLPTTWIRRVLEIRNAKPSAPAVAGRDDGTRVDMGAVPLEVIDALASVWPQQGEGCHDAALALGGILGDSHWTEDDIARFTGALFLATQTKDRTGDVLYSVGTRRNGGEAMGWPTLKAILNETERGKAAGTKGVDAVLRTLKEGVPGLRAPKVQLPQLDDSGRVVVSGAKAQLQLNIGSDDEIAAKVIELNCPAGVYDEGELWNFDDTRGVWAKIPEHVTSAWIEVFDGVVYDYTDKGRPIWIKLGQGRVNSIRRRIEAKRAQPGFFAEAPRGLAFQNGFLSLPGRQFEALKPEHRARFVLPCGFEPDAARRSKPKAWIRYLTSIWGSDTQSIELVHQLLGYLLSGRHDLQKIFVLLGPPRAGKGTLLNLIQSIFRDQATSFKVASLDQTFSMQSMLGKTVAYDPDVRRASSMFKSEGQMVERLLSISAHDVQVVPRKNLTDVVAALPARLLLAANPPFGLTDVGGALASRFVILTFPRSFLGSEDTGLGAALEAEIPAIVALALDGLDRLDKVGHFVEPASSAEERESVERAQNPMIGFLEDMCEVGDHVCECGKMFAAAQAWREGNGHKRMSNQAFSEFMRQKGFHQVRTGSDGARVRVYKGIRLIAGSGPTAQVHVRHPGPN
jgi:hypothetical protein